jgi:hypothetical protein
MADLTLDEQALAGVVERYRGYTIVVDETFLRNVCQFYLTASTPAGTPECQACNDSRRIRVVCDGRHDSYVPCPCCAAPPAVEAREETRTPCVGDPDVECCGNTHHLWFNGGELDAWNCPTCGTRWTTEATGYVLVRRAAATTPAPETP